MIKYVVISAALIISLVAVFFLIKKLILMVGGVDAECEVVSVREKKKGEYVHTVEFELNGEKMRKEDKTGYSQPIAVGTVKSIKVDPKDPANFEYAETLRLHVIGGGALLTMSILMILRFMFFVTD